MSDCLAHSAPDCTREGQDYSDHITGVRSGARGRAVAMLAYARTFAAGLQHAIDIAASFHDLGKLDDDIQRAFQNGRAARLRWDHVDAGVAHSSSKENWMAAWLIRAHHAPGLPKRLDHFDRDGVGRKLRGRRFDTAHRDDHAQQIVHTDAQLQSYLAAHERLLGKVDIEPARACHGLSMRLALSCLVDSDHSDAAFFDTGLAAPAAPEPRWAQRLDQLDRYVASLGSSSSVERDEHRIAFYRACRNAETEGPLVACEGPVGIGKTTAVSAYLLQRADKENLRHLFVVAPYTNIISQTAETLRKALCLRDEDPNEVVVEHHHRADFQDIRDRDLAVLWRAPIIVTTAVQFFETLASNHPSRLRKLHELPGSAIFLDEAHAALPTHLWPQNWRWLRELASDWKCRFVFASGSLTRFWENADIIDKPDQLPELLPPILAGEVIVAERKRICYRSLEGSVSSIEGIVDRVTAAPGPRLAIFNTVQSAAVVARAMHAGGHEIFHLSTALCPADRAKILSRIVDRLGELERPDWTLVATSCVEAGVDFSFRTAFRERFSTASLIQVGGRVNRHGEYSELGGGTVTDFAIDRGNGITHHPAAKYPAAVLRLLFKDNKFEDQDISPAQLVTAAMADELNLRGGIMFDALSSAERVRDYPEVGKLGRVIDSDTRLVVVDQEILRRLEMGQPVGFRDLLRGSVQIWADKIGRLELPPVRSHQDLYTWPYRYDPELLGYMAGVLEIENFKETGIAIF